MKKSIGHYSKHSVILLIGLFLLIFPCFTKANATSESTLEEGVPASTSGFTYQVQLPENQIIAEAGYYDLLMTPGQQQTIFLNLSNPSTETTTIDLALNSAKTNNNGVIEYSRPDIPNDASLKYDFAEIVNGPKSIELAPGETKALELDIQMPETSFEGVIAGGLTMKQAEGTTTESSEIGEGSYVNNKYAYAVVILLRENQTELLPDMAFNRAYVGQQNFRNTVFVSFSNTIADYLYGLTVDAQITPSDSQEVLWESRSTSMKMAPNSFMDYPINMGGDRMEPGVYTANVTAYVDDLKWQWSEDFEITQEEADTYNERDVGLEQARGIDWKIIAVVVASVLLVSLLIFVVVKRIQTRKKETAKKRKKSNQMPKKRK